MVSTIIKYTLESFTERTGVSNVVEVGRKSVAGGWATAGETSFLFLAERNPQATDERRIRSLSDGNVRGDDGVFL